MFNKILSNLFLQVFRNKYRICLRNIEQRERLVSRCKVDNLVPKNIIVNDPTLSEERFQLLSMLLINSLRNISKQSTDLVGSTRIVFCSFRNTEFISRVVGKTAKELTLEYEGFADNYSYVYPKLQTTFFNTDKEWSVR